MLRRNRFVALSVFLISGLLLVSCLGAQPTATPRPTATPTEAPAQPTPTEMPAVPTATAEPTPTEAPGDGGAAAEVDCMGVDGGTVSFIGQWSGDEEGQFMAVLQPFLDACNVEIQYEGTRDLAVYTTRIEGGNPPDIAGLPNPGILARYEQYMVPLGDVIDLSQFAQFWQDLGTVNGTVYGAFFKADNKSIVWYSPPVFDAYGWMPPNTWDELQTLMDDMVAQGDVPPWSCGMESQDATGWVATDWIQDILLRTQGADFIERWVRHEVAWTDPAIKDAWQTYYDICSSDTYAIGGAQGTLNTKFQDSISLVFQEPPEGYMVRQALFASGIISDQFPELTPGEDYTFFAFPQFNDQIGAPMQGGADVLAFFNADNQAAVAMMNYLLGAPGQQMVAQTGWGLAPNTNITADDYTDPFQGRAAELLNEAPAFSFDADDRMPGGLNTVYWQATVDYLSGGDLDQILQDLEQAAVEAYAQ